MSRAKRATYKPGHPVTFADGSWAYAERGHIEILRAVSDGKTERVRIPWRTLFAMYRSRIGGPRSRS